jgi:hypothetical protein
VTDFINIKTVAVFGKCLEPLFGIDASSFNRLRQKNFPNNESWLSNLDQAFNYCLIDRWLLFGLKDAVTRPNTKSNAVATVVANSIQFESSEQSECYVSIKMFLYDQTRLAEKSLGFCDDSFVINEEPECSIVDTTISENETVNENETILTQSMSCVSLREDKQLSSNKLVKNVSISSFLF